MAAGGPSPPTQAPPPLINPAHIPLPDNLLDSFTASNPISIPAAEFDNFENSYNSNNASSAISNPIASSLQACREASSVNSSNHDSRGGPVDRSRLRPILINSKASDIYEPMDVDQSADGARRKRPIDSSISKDAQDNPTTKKLSTSDGNFSFDSTEPGKAPRIQYSNSDIPPYIVHVHSVENDPTKLLHPLVISRTLSRIAYSDIKEIRKIGKGKVLAEMTSAKAANNLINSPRLQKEGLKAFVPTYRTIRSGIVKDIPQTIDENDLLEFFDAPCKVLEVRRLNRRVKIDGEVKYVPSRTVCLKFAGQLLPKYIFFSRTRYEVYPFIPKVQICFSCFRVGHISKSCKSKPRCLFCGDDVHEKDDPCVNRSNPPRCINCQGNHLATSHTCPVVSKHKLVLSLAATENIPIIEAKRKIHQTTPTSFSSPSQYNLDFRNFPLLAKSRNGGNSFPSDQFHNNAQNFNRFSPLTSLSSPEDNGNTFASRLSKPKKLSFSRANTSVKQNNTYRNYNNNNDSSTSGRSTRDSGSPLEDALYYPNGRPINVSGNGVAYGNSSVGAACSTPNIPLHMAPFDPNVNPADPLPSSSILHALNVLNYKISSLCSIDFKSLNDSISTLAKCLQLSGSPLAITHSPPSLA